MLRGRGRAKGCVEQRGTKQLCPRELCQLKVGRAAPGGRGAAVKRWVLFTCVTGAGVHQGFTVSVMCKIRAAVNGLTHVGLCWGGCKEQELPFMVCGVLDIQPLQYPAKSLSCWHILLNAAPGPEPCVKPKAPSSPSALHPHIPVV